MPQPHTNAELEVRLWDEIKRGRFGMLLAPADSGASVCQPMTAFAEPREAALWFYIADTTELARSVATAECKAMFIFQDKDQDLHACLSGRLRVDKDRSRLEKYWNPHVAAWFPGGKADPNLTMLCFEAQGAEVWLSETGPVKYGWEILKANATGSRPDVGEHAQLSLGR
ncbi:MAG: pyridoxamine 5'-phosphate oxidase family protein [Caulobacteraceae bacterium]